MCIRDRAIIDLQRPFFLEGDESLLRPMILKDVAERTGLDISTIDVYKRQIYYGFNLNFPYQVVSAKVNNRSEGLNFRVYNNNCLLYTSTKLIVS